MSGMAKPQLAWIGHLSPRNLDVTSTSVLPAAVLDALVAQVGAQPIGWAVEVGQGMARCITAELPALATDGVVQEIHKGCESVAVGALATLLAGQPPDWVLEPINLLD